MAPTARSSRFFARLVPTVAASAVLIGSLLGAAPASAARDTSPQQSTAARTARKAPRPVARVVPTNSSWLTTVNAYRRQAGLPPVRSNTSALSGVRAHACWMIRNDISHTPQPGRPGYTAIGAHAAAKSNLAVSNLVSRTDKAMIDLWMTAPFHAIGILRPNLQWASYGRCEGSGPYWKSASAMNVLDGVDNTRLRPQTPVVWPGNGTTTNLTTFVREVPDPVGMCGWSGQAGLPVIAMMPETVSAPLAVMKGPNGALLETCTLWHGNTTGAARSILGGENAMIVMPRKPLTAGTYTVTAVSGRRTITWSFTVKP